MQKEREKDVEGEKRKMRKKLTTKRVKCVERKRAREAEYKKEKEREAEFKKEERERKSEGE